MKLMGFVGSNQQLEPHSHFINQNQNYEVFYVAFSRIVTEKLDLKDELSLSTEIGKVMARSPLESATDLLDTSSCLPSSHLFIYIVLFKSYFSPCIYASARPVAHSHSDRITL